MEQPSFPDPENHITRQLSHTPPPRDMAHLPAQPRPNWVPKGSPEPQLRSTTSVGTWTSSVCLIRACQGKRDHLIKYKRERKERRDIRECEGEADYSLIIDASKYNEFFRHGMVTLDKFRVPSCVPSLILLLNLPGVLFTVFVTIKRTIQGCPNQFYSM